VLPGHIVEVSPDGTERDLVYWDLSDHWGKANGRPRPEGEYLEELSALLASSVRYRMISDVPLGAFLSGGIDSSLTVALMQKQSSLPVKTFSIGFAEKGYDESGFAREVARHLGTDHHEKRCTPAEALALVRKIPEAYDEPFADSSAIPTMLVSEFTRQHVTVSLSGDGGDELFCGYPRYEWVRQGRVIQGIPSFLRLPLCSLLSRVPIHKVQRAAESVRYDDAAQMYFHTVGIFQRRLLREMLPEIADDSHLLYYRTFGDVRWGGIVERAMATDIRTYLVDDILAKVDRASMAYSLEARSTARPSSRGIRRKAADGVQGPRGGDEAPVAQGPLRARSAKPLGPTQDGVRHPGQPMAAQRSETAPIGISGGGTNPQGGIPAPRGRVPCGGRTSVGPADHQYRLWALLVFGMWRSATSPDGPPP
jgi:asparagine synthase (glutamine-hydrolysing)